MQSLKDAGLWTLTLACLIAYNTPMGPWASDARWNQCKEALEHLLSTEAPHTCPLFTAMSNQLLKECRMNDAVGDEDSALMIWDYLAHHSPWRLKAIHTVCLC